jgi:hypothetical protein
MHGDLLGFHLGRSVHHTGILLSPHGGGALVAPKRSEGGPVLPSLGGGGFIHAIQNYGVIESTLTDPTYRRVLVSIWRRMEQLERYDDFSRARPPRVVAAVPAASPEVRA